MTSITDPNVRFIAYLTHTEIRDLLRQIPKEDPDKLLRSVARQCMLTVGCANGLLGNVCPEFVKAREMMLERRGMTLNAKAYQAVVAALKKACDYLESYNDQTLFKAYDTARRIAIFRNPLDSVRHAYKLGVDYEPQNVLDSYSVETDPLSHAL